MNNTVVSKVFEALSKGEELTTSMIRSRFGVSNPRQPIYLLRQDGYPINTITKKDSKGREVRKYVLNNLTPAAVSYTIAAR